MHEVGPGVWDNKAYTAKLLLVYLGGYKDHGRNDPIPHLFGWNPSVRVIAKSLIGTWGSERVAFDPQLQASHHDNLLSGLVGQGRHDHLIVAAHSGGTIPMFDLATRWLERPPPGIRRVDAWIVSSTPHPARDAAGTPLLSNEGIVGLLDVDLAGTTRNLAAIVDDVCAYLSADSREKRERLAVRIRYSTTQLAARQPSRVIPTLFELARFIQIHGFGYCLDLGNYVGTRDASDCLRMMADAGASSVLLRGENDTICGPRGFRYVTSQVAGKPLVVAKAGHNPVQGRGLELIALLVDHAISPEKYGIAKPFSVEATRILATRFDATAAPKVERSRDFGLARRWPDPPDR
jgi:hypothetical protein